jgi:hypothetical protein
VLRANNEIGEPPSVYPLPRRHVHDGRGRLTLACGRLSWSTLAAGEVEMTDRMILYAQANLDGLDQGRPPFVNAKVVEFGHHMPQRFWRGDVIVYSQRRNTTFAYLGLLRDAVRDAVGRTLSFARYVPFPVPIVACDEAHGVDRRELYEPNKGWGDDFNYITVEAHEAILHAAQNPTEALLWQAINTCAGSPAHDARQR